MLKERGDFLVPPFTGLMVSVLSAIGVLGPGGARCTACRDQESHRPLSSTIRFLILAICRVVCQSQVRSYVVLSGDPD